MKFLEKDLETIVFEADPTLIHARGLHAYRGFQKKYRQLNLGKYGISDIITFNFCKDYTIEITVYELKQEVISAGTLLQAIGYCKGIEQALKSLGVFDHHLIFSVVLVGSKVDTSSNFCYIPDYLFQVSLYTYSYEIDGIYFKEQSGYSLADVDFSPALQKELSELLLIHEGITGLCPDDDIPEIDLSQDEKEELPF